MNGCGGEDCEFTFNAVCIRIEYLGATGFGWGYSRAVFCALWKVLFYCVVVVNDTSVQVKAPWFKQSFVYEQNIYTICSKSCLFTNLFFVFFLLVPVLL